MLSFLLRRILQSLLVLLVILTISFVLVRAVPGNPFATEQSSDRTQQINQMKKFGLTKPIFPIYTMPDETDATPIIWDEEPDEFVIGGVHVVYGLDDIAETQFVGYIIGLFNGDFGLSMTLQRGRPVAEMIGDAIGYSVQLGVQALFVALLLGVPAGIYAGLRQNTWRDYSVMTAAMIGISIPNFVLGPLLILVFAMNLEWLDPNGWDSFGDSILPSLALGLYFSAYIARLSRGGMLEITRQDFIRTARAKGLAERIVVARHALKGALLPVVSYLGPATAALLTGSVVIEEIFALPGIGKYFVDAAFTRDYNVVLGMVVVYSLLLIALNIIVDIAYTILDPRVRVG